MQISEERQRGVVVVAPAGRIDSTTAVVLEQYFSGLSGADARRIVVDLAGAEYISSAGLRVMLVLAKRVRENGGSLALCDLSESVRQVFDLAGFVPLFAIEATREAAIVRVAGP
jgi:stage II sporulation protein AA (anti-sigma F factor antagonist)